MNLKLYLVRWGNGDTEIVSATDKDDLFDVLDQVGDPYAAVYRRYTGPIRFSVKADPEEGGIVEFYDETAICDDRSEMEEAIRKVAFPALQAQIDKEGLYSDPDLNAKAIEQDRATLPTTKGWMSYNEAGWVPPYARSLATKASPQLEQRQTAG